MWQHISGSIRYGIGVCKLVSNKKPARLSGQLENNTRIFTRFRLGVPVDGNFLEFHCVAFFAVGGFFLRLLKCGISCAFGAIGSAYINYVYAISKRTKKAYMPTHTAVRPKTKLYTNLILMNSRFSFTKRTKIKHMQRGWVRDERIQRREEKMAQSLKQKNVSGGDGVHIAANG